MSAILPSLSTSQLQQYFSRINYDGNAAPDLDVLQALHYRHPLHIPFENLSSLNGLPVPLEPENIFAKLVSSGRGGYCFEQNQLFMRVLQSIGFQVQGLSARVVWMLPDGLVLPRTHMALLVTLDGRRYLADVGFGGVTMTGAIELDEHGAQQTPHEQFRISEQQGIHTVSVCLANQWQEVYRFSLDPYLPVDYETANWYVSTHPQSRFVNQLICCRADTEGRHALLNQRYARYLPGNVPQVTELGSPEEIDRLLRDTFRINTAELPHLHDRLQRLIEEQDAS